jgi:hypothetical protein
VAGQLVKLEATMSDEEFELSRRKTLFGLGATGIASAGIGMGAGKFFSDREEFTGNTIQAGKLDLLVDYETSVSQNGIDTESTAGGSSPFDGSAMIDGNPASQEYSISDLKPGDSGQWIFCPKIVDNPGWLWIGSANGLTTFESSQTEPETTVDDTAGGPNNGEEEGEIAESIQVSVSYLDAPTPNDTRQLDNPDGYTLADLFEDLENGFLLDGNPFSSNSDEPQAYPGSPTKSAQPGPCLRIEWKVPASVGNEIQTDMVNFDVTFIAIQARHNQIPDNPFAD